MHGPMSVKSAGTLSPCRGVLCAFIPRDLMQVHIQRLAHFLALLLWHKSPEKVISTLLKSAFIFYYAVYMEAEFSKFPHASLNTEAAI
jgi:hypothetical protein